MEGGSLSGERRMGLKIAIYVDLLVLVLSLIILASGSPIVYFHTLGLSAVYVVLTYLPVIVVCIFALRKLANWGGGYHNPQA